jgi:hypothetical protein
MGAGEKKISLILFLGEKAFAHMKKASFEFFRFFTVLEMNP